MRKWGKSIWAAGIVLIWFVLVTGTADQAWGLATETLGNKPLSKINYEEWKGKEIMPVINHTSRVYHTWVNGNEHFYYSGDIRALNYILEKFVAVKVEVREVIIRPGPAETMTFRNKRIRYDWRLHLLTGIAGHNRPPGSEMELGEKNPTLTVFVDSRYVKLEELQIPEGITVIGPDELRKRYLKGLKSEDSRTRGMAAYRLAELEPYNKENVGLIVKLLDDEGDAPYLAVGALGKMGKTAESALPAIKRALKSQSNLKRNRFLEVIQEIESAPDTTAQARVHQATLDKITKFLKSLAEESILPQDPKGNFVLFVSNQSFAINPVDITVHIDGKKAIAADFDVKGKTVAQHNWIRHQFSLSPGRHKLRVESKKGEARLEREFEVEEKHWAVIDYWYYPKVTGGAGPTPRHFSFWIQDKPILFQ